MSTESLRKQILRWWDRLPRWITVFGWAGRDFVIDNGMHWSASIAFYCLLSIFPLALAGVAIAAWFVDPAWATRKASDILGELMLRGDTLRDIIDQAIALRGQTSVLSIVLLVVAGSRVFAVLIRALNIAFDADEVYGFLKRLLVELGMLLTIGLFFIGALVSDLAIPVVGHLFRPIPHGKTLALQAIGWVLPALLLLGGFFALYKFVPRERCNWQGALLGALGATAGCLCARPLFGYYVSKLAGYSHIYGWLGIGIVLLVWAQIVGVIVLYCGELASHIQMMLYEGLSGQEVSRRHRIRAPGSSNKANGRADESFGKN